MTHHFLQFTALLWVLSLWSKAVAGRNTTISPTFISGEWKMDEGALILSSYDAFAEYVFNDNVEQWDTFAISVRALSTHGYTGPLSKPVKGGFNILVNGVEYLYNDRQDDVVTFNNLDPTTIYNVTVSVAPPNIGVVISRATAFRSSPRLNIQKRRMEKRSDDEEDGDITPQESTTNTDESSPSSTTSSSSENTQINRPFTEVSPQRTASVVNGINSLTHPTSLSSSTNSVDPTTSTTSSTSGATLLLPSIVISSVSAVLIALSAALL